jgi:hypothetical protein
MPGRSVCVRRIFEELYSERVVARDIYDQKDPTFTTAKYLWATWKAHAVMERYLRHQIYEHPSISAVLARHLADNYVKPDDAQASKIKALEAAIKTLQSKYDALWVGMFQPPSSPPLPCWVLAEGWAGWLAILCQANFRCDKLFCHDVTCPRVLKLSIIHPGCAILPLSSLSDHLVPPTWIFLQGSGALLQLLPSAWVSCSNILLSTSISLSPPPQWHVIEFSHLEAGGGGYLWFMAVLFQCSILRCQALPPRD